MKQYYKKFQSLYEQYERLLIPGMLLFGFLLDLFTFRTVNVQTAFIFLGIHASIVGIVIVFLNSFDEGKWQLHKRHPLRYMRLAAPLLLQFSMGALLSAVMIFYMFSGAFSVSWPFLVFIGILMISNEIFREYYLQPIVQLPVYYLVLFALGALVLPFLIKRVNIFVFALAGILAMIIVYILYRIIRSFVPAIQQEEPILIITVGVLYGVMLALYITNIIPPIPLSVRDIGVYHSIESQEDGYILAAEKQPWYEHVIPGQTVHAISGNPIYVYTAIFAPNQLETSIVHEWEWYNTDTEQWELKDTLGYTITGGRKNGFRGYTQKSSLLAGKWRVTVKTDHKKTLGRISFTLIFTETIPDLTIHTK